MPQAIEIEYKGRLEPLKALVKNEGVNIYKLSYDTVYRRHRKGKKDDELFLTPAVKRSKKDYGYSLEGVHPAIIDAMRSENVNEFLRACEKYGRQ